MSAIIETPTDIGILRVDSGLVPTIAGRLSKRGMPPAQEIPTGAIPVPEDLGGRVDWESIIDRIPEQINRKAGG